MAQNTDLNVSPYYDDYDETKDFHRILFRPANAIQARELTQLQSILQNQVEKFGNHIFDEGSLVMGGTITVNTEYHAVKVNETRPNDGVGITDTILNATVDLYLEGQTSKVVGKVINTCPTGKAADKVTAQTDPDAKTLYVTYVKSNADQSGTQYTTFTDNEELHVVTLAANGSYSSANNSTTRYKTLPTTDTNTPAIKTGSAAIIRSGIFYTKGFFVRCDEQTILLDKYGNTPTYRIGLQITETLITSADDSSLLDNATGSSNENAPGANRLKIDLTLVKKPLSGTQDIDNFIELSRVEEGTITKQTNITAYNAIERTLARRTYDESGDYVTNPFQMEAREHLNNLTNNGVYLSTNTSIPGESSKFVSIMSPGKGYVKGFEVDKPVETFVTFDKARDTGTLTNLAVPFQMGNYYNINNVYGMPDFGKELPSSIEPYGSVLLRDTLTSTGGTPAGAQIGVARCRYFNLQTAAVSSNIQTSSALYRIHLFDVRMFTKLTVVSAGSYALTAGQRVKGSSSGAKATIAVTAGATATTLYLMDVEGSFIATDEINLEKDSTSDAGPVVAASGVKKYSSDDVRSISQVPKDTTDTGSSGGPATFTGDPILTDNQFTLSGTIKSLATNDKTVTGVNTVFTQELKAGDVLIPPGGTSIGVVDTITSDIELELVANAVTAESGKFLRQRSLLKEQEKTVAISPTPRDFIKSVTPNQVTLRKQTFKTFSAGSVSVSVAGDETLVTKDINDYTVAVHHNGSTDNNTLGQVIDINQAGATLALAGNSLSLSIAHASAAALDADDDVKVGYTITKNVADDNATKTLNKSRAVKVTTPASTGSQSTVYGTNYDDEMITLGVPDVYRVGGIFESQQASTAALPPTLTVASGFTAAAGDEIVGATSNAVGKVIQHSSTTTYFYYLTETKFAVGETITNKDNTNSSTNSTATSAVTEPSKDITGNYLVDDGQRDGYYALGAIKRKAGAPSPQNQILIILDYFTASASDNFFTADSYSGIEWEHIPRYVPNIIDPGGLEPDGEFELSDAIDYRSYVGVLHDPSTAPNFSGSITDVSGITSQPFAYASHSFSGTNAVVFDLPQAGSSLTTTSVTQYLPRIDKISLSTEGQFIVTKGQSADDPTAPNSPSNSILLHTLYLPPYTADLSRISVKSNDHRRFTMRDIGRIQGRVKNLERVTSLNALEQETNLHQVQDADGFDRFKSGFVTDNFRGHKTGDVNHPDYKIGVDRTTGTLRPMHHSRFVGVSINTTSSANYQKTGDLITLPYTEEAFVDINKASTTEFVNPYDIVLFNGTVTLNPSRDLWFDTQRLPSVRRTIEGDYDTVIAGIGNAMGTIWNNWQTDWTGEPVTTIIEPAVTRPGPTITRGDPGRTDRIATPRNRNRAPGSTGLSRAARGTAGGIMRELR